MPAEIKLEPVKPEKAIEYWKTKRPLTAEERRELEKGARERAMTVAGLARHQQLAAVHGALGKALEEGKTLAQFKKEIKPLIQSQGWSGWRVENIFRTNLASAYAAGAWAEIRANKDAFPYLEYMAVGDDRTRPAHAVLDGKVWPVDHEFWAHNYPPNGFGCRCTTAPVSRWRAEQKGVKVEKDLPANLSLKGPGGYPVHVAAPGADPGFTNNAGLDWLAGLTPQELDKALTFGPARTVCPVGGNFAGEEGPCGLPLEKIDRRHILEVRPGDILPVGESEEFYAKEFLKCFGLKGLNGSALVKIPGTKLSLPVSKALLTDKLTGQLKANKYGRGRFMRLLAETIRNPFEVWWAPAKMAGNDKDYEALRLIRLFRDEKGGEIGGLGIFNWVPGMGWRGTTVFTPGSVNRIKNMANYLEKQREGILVYREK